MDLVVSFIKNGILPKDKLEAEKIQRKAQRYWLSEEQMLYKCSYSGTNLLCIKPEVVKTLLREFLEVIYGNHTRRRSLSHRALTQRYWWPIMQKSAQEFAKKCNQCQ